MADFVTLVHQIFKTFLKTQNRCSTKNGTGKTSKKFQKDAPHGTIQ